MLEPTQRFSSRAAHYHAHRPRYPVAAFDRLARDLTLSPGWVVADIGSGTGILAEPMLDRGCTVIAVEPNPAMLAVAHVHYRHDPRFHAVFATAEATALAPESIDLITAAQAFHWFDPAGFRAECVRILREPGALAVFWNQRLIEGNPFLEAYESLLRRYEHERLDMRQRYVAHNHDALRRVFGGSYQHATFPNVQLLDRDGLIQRTFSCSYMPASGSEESTQLATALDTIFETHQRDGRVTIDYTTHVYYGLVYR